MSGPVDRWMPWHIGKYLADTSHLNAEQHGAYDLLLMGSWMREGKLPDADEQLRTICKLTPEKWRKHKPILQKFFRVEDGHWIQKRLMEEYLKALENQKSASNKGKNAANSRWKKRRDDPEPALDPANPWSVGKLLLHERDGMSFKQAGAFIGKLMKEHDEPSVLAAFKAAQEKTPPPAEVKSFVLGILRAAKKAKGFSDELERIASS